MELVRKVTESDHKQESTRSVPVKAARVSICGCESLILFQLCSESLFDLSFLIKLIEGE